MTDIPETDYLTFRMRNECSLLFSKDFKGFARQTNRTVHKKCFSFYGNLWVAIFNIHRPAYGNQAYFCFADMGMWMIRNHYLRYLEQGESFSAQFSNGQWFLR